MISSVLERTKLDIYVFIKALFRLWITFWKMLIASRKCRIRHERWNHEIWSNILFFARLIWKIFNPFLTSSFIFCKLFFSLQSKVIKESWGKSRVVLQWPGRELSPFLMHVKFLQTTHVVHFTSFRNSPILTFCQMFLAKAIC